MFRYWISETAQFWHLAAKYPDLGISILIEERHCLVDSEPSRQTRRDYSGPVRLMDSTGTVHQFYFLFAHIKETQASVAREMKKRRMTARSRSHPDSPLA